MADLSATFATAATQASQRPIPTPPAGGNPAEMGAAAQDFEAFFMSHLLEQMYAGIKSDGPFGGGHGEEVFRSFLLQEYGKILAERGGLGLADSVVRDMLKLQEVG